MTNKFQLKGFNPSYFFHYDSFKVKRHDLGSERHFRSGFIEAHFHSIEKKFRQDNLSKERVELIEFYDFPLKHWQSILTPNPIESTFTTIRYRPRTPRGVRIETARCAWCSSWPVYQIKAPIARIWQLVQVIEGQKIQGWN